MQSLSDLTYSPWGRAAGIVLRTAHLAAMALLVGAVWFAAPGAALGTWRTVTAATGLALLLLEIGHSKHWVYQGRGLLALLHVGSLVLVAVPAVGGRGATIAALGLGAVGSHLPRAVRKWSLRHRRVVD